MKAAKAFFRSARTTVGFRPDRVTTDGHGSYPRAIRSVLGKRVRHRTSACLNNPQIAQGQPVVPPAEHHEGDDVAGQAGPVQHAAAALVELPAAGPAAEPPVATRRHFRPLCHSLRATAHAVHLASPALHPLSKTLRRLPDQRQIPAATSTDRSRGPAASPRSAPMTPTCTTSRRKPAAPSTKRSAGR